MAKRQKNEPAQLMVVNDIPGEECRIAILEDNRLEELYTERVASATGVGNIYKGRVVNVEPAIQAAFVDYGEGKNGFLHISDLHPRYFPGEERTERVGRKIPRRERPPMQAALRRGDEILVQVIKEGIGTKGPTLTSYLSIPGRLMVMMPHMDNVGVSRKIDDEEKRKKMRDILDSLDLPEGFGFILRTAGFDRTKTELKRDLAYLTRLWKKMEKRIEKVSAPCALYTESDLLIRTIRDVLSNQVEAVVVDSESAFDRTRDFLSIIAPRSAPKVIRYRGVTPVFHSFDIERQIELIHQKEVPLPSGGAIVIEQTEALVAIDVNSGRSRSARDSETNAYHTNKEAVDEICRQLRLRDLGGLLIMDLIDMNAGSHRRSIEERMRNNLKRDRAKTTVLRLSEFGIMEMTRQRMRPSLRKSHFAPCPTCHGKGEIRNAETIAADSLRHAGYLMQYDRVKAVEIVCSPRVASVLLSGKRRTLVRLEDESGKDVRVRVSETIETDRVDYFAYDERSADIDITQLPPLNPPSLKELEKREKDWEKEAEARGESRRRSAAEAKHADRAASPFDLDDEDEDIASFEDDPGDDEADTDASDDDAARSDGEGGKKKRRRRRRRRKRGGGGSSSSSEEQQTTEASKQSAADSNGQAKSEDGAAGADGEGGGKKKRRRRRRRRRKDGSEAKASGGQPGQPGQSSDDDSVDDADRSADDASDESKQSESSDASGGDQGAPTGKKKRRRRRRKSGGKSEGDQSSKEGGEDAPAADAADAGEKKPAPQASSGDSAETADTKDEAPPKKKRRSRKKKTSGESAAAQNKDDSSAKAASSKSSSSDNGQKKDDKGAKADGDAKDAKKGDDDSAKSTKKPRRSLYRSRTKVSAGALKSAAKREE